MACSRGSGNIVTITPSTTADVIAPPAPWRNRAATSHACDCARPHSSDAPLNTTSPARKIVRREMRSPIRPASISRPPNAIRYALTTQARSELEYPRSSWIDGSATFTTVTSSTIISIPTQSTTSAAQRLSCSVDFVRLMRSPLVRG